VVEDVLRRTGGCERLAAGLQLWRPTVHVDLRNFEVYFLCGTCWIEVAIRPLGKASKFQGLSTLTIRLMQARSPAGVCTSAPFWITAWQPTSPSCVEFYVENLRPFPRDGTGSCPRAKEGKTAIHVQAVFQHLGKRSLFLSSRPDWIEMGVPNRGARDTERLIVALLSCCARS